MLPVMYPTLCTHYHIYLSQQFYYHPHFAAAAAAAKSLQLCPTLCDPIDDSPPGSPIPGIIQARTLEWVAIAFSHPHFIDEKLGFRWFAQNHRTSKLKSQNLNPEPPTLNIYALNYCARLSFQLQVVSREEFIFPPGTITIPGKFIV